MKKVCCVALVALLAACAAPPAPVAAPPAPPAPPLEARRAALDAAVADYWEYVLRTNPEYASILGDKRYNDRLADASEQAVLEDLQQTRAFQARFQAIDATGLPEQEALTRTLLLQRFDRTLRGERFADWQMPVNQFTGLHIDLPNLVSLLPFDQVKDYDDYVARLRQVPQVLAQTEDLMRKGMIGHRVPPRFLMEKVAQQARAVIARNPADSPFAAPLRRFPKGIGKSRPRLRAAVLDAIAHDVQPAYERFASFVEREYAPAGRAQEGVWALPDGDDYYAYLVEGRTTTQMTPAQIHQLGLDEVARIEAEMLGVARQLGFADLPSLVRSTDANPKLHPRSRGEILQLYRGYVDQMWAKLPQLFGRLPKARVEVLPVEPYREKDASGAEYNQGTPDGSRPGHIMVNTRNPAAQKTLEIETTAYHEGVPGHHLQISIAQELPQLPPVRQQMSFTAYVEGWALYSERLGREVGFYQDPYSLFGHLQDDMLRAIRLVVDTGIHYRHWTRQQVVDYFHAHSGGMDEDNVQSETDRYIAVPGQALGYKIGQLTILRLREKAKAALGARFDLRAFHDEVLGAGALPMDLLERRIDAWIARQGIP